MKGFEFDHLRQREKWAQQAPGAWELLIVEMKPFLLQPIPDDPGTLRMFLRKYAEYFNRLSYVRASLETFYAIASSQRFVHHGSSSGKSTISMCKEKAAEDCAPISFMLDLAKFTYESMRVAKSSCQSVLAIEREGIPRGAYNRPGE